MVMINFSLLRKIDLSIICFKLAEITNGNELENSKYGLKHVKSDHFSVSLAGYKWS